MLDSPILEALSRALYHRGPNGQGVYTQPTIALVHTRLAIIDVEGGHQPFLSPHGISTVVNGEIYNYQKIRHQFPEYPFKTASDCESILPLYEKYDLEFTRFLRGMYAIALYDPLKNVLILARDPFGIKPLYYAPYRDGVVFASEIQAILATGLVSRTVNASAAFELLQQRYTTGSTTLVQGVHRVLPGETLVIKNGQVINRFSQSALPAPSLNSPDFTDDKALDLFTQTMEESVRLHLQSDVPYGLFLSGGLDSAAILALMSRYTKTPIRTYTIGFSGTSTYDERVQARRLATYFKTDHQEFDFTEQDFWNLLPAVAAAMDDPAIDYALLPTYKMAHSVKDQVRVILCGEGGDEILAGYRRYQKMQWPWWLGGGRLFKSRGVFDGLGVLLDTSKRWQDAMRGVVKVEESKGRTKIQTRQAIDCAQWLPNDLLTKLDRCLMAHSIEGRPPFVDKEVAGHLFNLPDSYKVRRGQGKWILRQWLARYVPVAEPFAKKRGFTVPVEEWISRISLDVVHKIMVHPALEGVACPKAVKKLYQDPRNKRALFAGWALLFYVLWYHHHILGHPFKEDVKTTLGC